METTFDRTSVFSLTAALVLCGAAFAGRYVAAEDKQSPPAPTFLPQQSGVPILSRIPYVNRLFKNTPADDGCERIGIDFNFAGQQCQQCVAQESCNACEAACKHVCKQTCEQCDTLCVRPFGICLETCDEDESAEESGDDLFKTVLLTLLEERHEVFDVVERIRREQLDREDGLHDSLLEASITAAAAQAESETRTEFAEREMQILKELVQAKMENVVLTAKLQVAEQKEKLAADMLQLQLENSQLKEQLASHDSHPNKRSRAAERTAKTPAEMKSRKTR